MSKVRVYELAKEYGMRGPDLAKMLKELGFEAIKSHMAVLDDATELHARAVMEAQGFVRGSEADATAEAEEAEERTVARREAGGGPPKKRLPSRKSLPPPVQKPIKKKLPEAPTRTATGATSGTPAPVEPATEVPRPEPSARESAAPEPRPQEAMETTQERIVEAPRPEKTSGQAETPSVREEVVREEAQAPPAPERPAAEAAPPGEAEAPAAPARPEAPAEATPKATPAAESPAAPQEAPKAADAPQQPPKPPVKRLLVPEARAKVVGRIELPQEAISDAKRRSAPSTGRNPGSVDRNLRRAAQRSLQSRSASARPGGGGRGAPPRRGPTGRRGVGQRRGKGSMSNLSSTVDPSKVIEIEPPITVKGLSEAIGVRVNDLIAVLTFKLGVVGKNINSFLTNDEVELVALEVNRNIRIVERAEAEEELLRGIVDAARDVEKELRAPVVTFMGHVDHGKTSLLDALRKSDVVKSEAGGITQHVGAYKVTWHDGSEFVVLDTPGHEAFTAMRARGARLTDVVVLVVAADDGVMPQTEEAIAHAKAAETPIIVAINKCDRPDARPMQVKQQLSVKGLQAEDWGGDVQMVEVSALSGQGLDDLVERIMLQAEILELTAKPDAPGEAVVIESRQTPEQGVTVNVLVINGTLRVRDQVLCGESLSRIRGIIDDHGNQLDEAPPSTPVQLLGLTSLPSPGDKLFVVDDKKKAREVVADRQRHARNLQLAERSKITAENLRAQLQQRQIEEIKIILKADVMGSLEPIRSSLSKLDTDEVRVNVLHSALGGITEADVNLAQASGAMVIGFNTVADQAARLAAERGGVEMRFYSIIYELIDDVKLAMEGRLKPEEVEEVIGHAEVRAVFRSSKFGNIAGCYVLDGVVKRNAKLRLSRDGRVVHRGELASLRREKDDVREVKAGFECGMLIRDFNDIKEGDQLEFFDVKLVKRTLA